jgi:hypothetical protein
VALAYNPPAFGRLVASGCTAYGARQVAISKF